ncbi:MAG: hypothetical protein ACE5HN_11230 [Nitrospiria bacterium]
MKILSLMLLPILLSFPLQVGDPISLELLFDGVPTLGGGWVLTITVEAKVDLDQLDIEVETSKGLTLVSGETRWQGALASGEEAVIEISLTMIELPPQEVRVRLKGHSSEGVAFEREAVRSIGGPQGRRENHPCRSQHTCPV